MKVRIDDIYTDNHTLFTDNTLLNNDERLADIMQFKEDMDLIAEMSFGARELLRRNIKEDTQHVFIYDLNKINRHIYACMVENMHKYNVLLASLEYEDVEPNKEYYEKITHGEDVKTNVYGAKTDTTTYGDVNVERVAGATSESTTQGARENTSSVTSFSSDTFNPTDKATSAQAVDTTQFGSQTNTEHSERANDTKTFGTHTDTFTNDETIDEKEGYRDLWANVEKKKRVYDKSILLEIVTECVNAISYSMYL